MSKILAILGAGHLGQQIAHYAISDNHYEDIVFFDDFTSEDQINGFRVLGTTKDIEIEYEKKTFDELIIGIGYKHLKTRKNLFERFISSIPFGKVVHSSAWIDHTAKIENGCVIYPMCAVDANSVIGVNTILNVGCIVAHDTIVGKHCFLSPRVALAGFIEIGELCILGINATVIDNLKITSETQIGGGTVVIKEILNSGLYVGNPHRFIR